LEEENVEGALAEKCQNYIRMSLSTRLFNALPELEKKHRKDLLVEDDMGETGLPQQIEEEEDDNYDDMDEGEAEERRAAREERQRAVKKKQEERERVKQLWAFPQIIGRAHEYKNCIYELLNVSAPCLLISNCPLSLSATYSPWMTASSKKSS
jgi:hypothetical protein